MKSGQQSCPWADTRRRIDFSTAPPLSGSALEHGVFYVDTKDEGMHDMN